MGLRVEGLEELRADLRESAERALDPQPALELWAGELSVLIDSSFRTQTSPEGEAWAPRKMTTRSRVGGPEKPRSRSAGRRVGELTGAMRASVDVEVTPRAVVVDVGAAHAAFFVGGTRHQPARSFVPLSDAGKSGEALDELAEQLADFVTEPLRV